MVSDLIFDIGMHTGKDTAYSLKRGFQGVGVEANEALARGVAELSSGEVAAGRSKIYNVAIAETELGATGKYYRSPLRKLHRLMRSVLRVEPVGGYDIHGKLPG